MDFNQKSLLDPSPDFKLYLHGLLTVYCILRPHIPKLSLSRPSLINDFVAIGFKYVQLKGISLCLCEEHHFKLSLMIIRKSFRTFFANFVGSENVENRLAKNKGEGKSLVNRKTLILSG
jgi:hypothetical protein